MDYTDHGELAGYLQQPKCVGGVPTAITDPLTGVTTECVFTTEQADQARVLLMLPRIPRVVLVGLVQYENDYPVLITVEGLEVLPNAPEGLAAVQGIDITGGVDSADYVRGLRDGN